MDLETILQQNNALMAQVAAMLATQHPTQEKGDTEEMRKLKYGQGSIIKRKKTGKKGGTYEWYEARYYDKYGIRRTCTYKTKEECRHALLQFKKHNSNKSKRQVKLFGQYFQDWYNAFRKNEVTEKTNQLYQTCIDKVPSTIKKLNISQITALELQAHLNSIKSLKMRYWTKLLISSCIKQAVIDGILSKDITANLIANQPTAKKRNVLSIEDEPKLLELVGKNYRTHLICYLYTGCRPSEAKRITESDIDRINNTILIKGAVKGKNIKKISRGEYKLYKIPLLPEIAQMRFPLPSVSNSNFCKSVSKACEKLGIKVTPKDMRHTFATRCREKGVDLKTYSEWLGHSSIEITADLYSAHTSNELFKKEAQKLQNITPISTPI
jgi:integrase